jgi:hypothetical protein
MQKCTYTVRFCTRADSSRRMMQKCTGKTGPASLNARPAPAL